ncbi:PBSX family phage terminase large subunit [Paenibacillus sp. S-38]|uniref:PBSX family phage terminase large subunit n=1 Tax=Paenibacillus sp. S-38 TaxID=3416710 RepID=UPI003CF3456C
MAIKRKQSTFRWKPFSKKQIQVLTWWMKGSPHADKHAVICDGSVRAGKTVAMCFSYVAWATENFDGQQFGMAGKTIGALRRNVVGPLKMILRGRGYNVTDKHGANYLTISRGGVSNDFYLFGGKDERSQDLIQGVTLAGMFFDEVALMPESFVNQATARCSISGAKFWFNCNPAGPYHWFKVEWLDKLEKKNALHIHFTMDDNLSLDAETKKRYFSQYTGVFYKRYILGLWVMASGVIYDMFDAEVGGKHVVKTVERRYMKYYVSCDYGTQNPMAYGLWGLSQGVWYKIDEFHYDGRKEGKQKDNEEYYAELVKFVGDAPVKGIIIDPSAASFIATIQKHGRFGVIKAKNDVLEGIHAVAMELNAGTIKYNDICKETIREYSSYIWDEKAADRGEEKPVKQNDHHMDGDRYFVYTIVHKGANPLDRMRRLSAS